MKVIVLASLSLAGKTTYAKIIGPKYALPLFETGTVVLEEVTGRGLDFTPENIKKVTDECKKKSDSYFTERLIERINQVSTDVRGVFVSGVRAMSEIKVLRKHFGLKNVNIIAFHASVPTRFKRLNNPDRIAETKGAKAKEDELLRDFDNFMARNEKELSYGVGDIIASSDYLINTENERWPYHNVKKCTQDFENVIKEILNIV